MEALRNYRSKGEQKMTVQHVHVAGGGQAIVGNVSASAEGGGAKKKLEVNSLLLDMRRASRCHATSKRSGKRCRSPAVKGYEVCRMHGAGGGAPKGNRNTMTHGGYTAEAIRTRRMVAALTRQARKLVETI
jgi:hypothetical protein